jgi:hypothetical protein
MNVTKLARKWGLPLAACGVLGLGMWTLKTRAQVPAPVLKITQTTSNEFQVQITNGVGYANYELQRRAIFHPEFPWTLSATGAMGQSNFTVSMGIEVISSFFQVTVGRDWDQDGLANYADAQPTNALVTNLVITIDSPVSGFDLR